MGQLVNQTLDRPMSDKRESTETTRSTSGEAHVACVADAASGSAIERDCESLAAMIVRDARTSSLEYVRRCITGHDGE